MNRLRLIAVAALACLSAVLPTASFALPVMDITAETLIFQVDDLKKSLNLSPNQQVLWQQVESKAQALLRARKVRREHLQADVKEQLQNSRTELRELATRIDQESDLAAAENRQLREFLLTMNDALDDGQRQIVLNFLADQLQRMPDQGRNEKSGERESNGRSGMRKQRRSGGMEGTP